MVVKQIVIPKRYLKKDRTGKTVYIQDSQGFMQGRKSVPKGRQDNTRSMRLNRDLDIDVNKDGRISKDEHFEKGQIFGRSTVRGSARARGTIRRF